MKLGVENRKEVIAAIVLAVGALLALMWAFSSSGPSKASAPQSQAPQTPQTNAPAPAPSAARRQPAGPTALDSNSIDPTLRLDVLQTSENVQYEGKGRNIFSAQSEIEIPKPIISPIKKKQEQQPVGPPPPPPIDLKFYGFAKSPDQRPSIFLSQGENIFVAREGDIVNRRYKVVRIMPNAVEIEDVLNNNRQSIPLSQG